MPADTVLVADNFKIGAELGFALGDPRIRVLDHPLNRHHGRAPQLALWGLQLDGTQDLDGRPALVVVGATDVKFSALLDRYQTLCARFGSLPVTRVVNADRGAQRFVLSRIESDAPAGACVTPAVAHIDTPAAGARAHGVVDVRGWAVKDVSGIASVAVTLDGVPVAEAVYGQPNGWVAGFLQNRARDPSLPDVGFSARVDLGDRAPGLYWLGLRITGGDGSVEDWAEQPLRITAPARTD